MRLCHTADIEETDCFANEIKKIYFIVTNIALANVIAVYNN